MTLLRLHALDHDRSATVLHTPFQIGRGPHVDLRLQVPEVSNLHCAIVSTDDGFALTDLGSANGTYLDDQPVRGSAPLPLGSTLRLGALSWRVDPPPTPSHTRPWGRALLDRVTCPSCWHRFAPEDVFFVAHHVDLIGDPVLGPDASRRFQPTRFTARGEALDPRGTPTDRAACPRCHLTLPDGALEADLLPLAITGSPASGKSHLLAALAWSLRTDLPRRGIVFTDADAEANAVVHDYERLLFLNDDLDRPVELPKTQPDDPRLYRHALLDGTSARLLRPLQFTLRPREAPSRVLCLFDNAGEDFLPGAAAPGLRVTDHLAHVHALLFVYDPLQDPRVRRALSIDAPRASHRQETVLREVILRARRARGLSERQRLPIPLTVIVSKLDAWEPLLASPFDGEPDDSTHARTRELLLDHTPELVALAEDAAEDVRFVPVSSLGRPPEWVERDGGGFWGVRPRDVQPRWVTAPLLPLLNAEELPCTS